MKYKKRSDNIYTDFQYYLGQECLFHYLYGHKLTKNQRQKVHYIWKVLSRIHKIYI